ncbi:DUF2071 domain-containing protein [Williamsia sp.]|uniref:DUF2071 domain-containing protein n=1 Tax=Williamsia sp. TaxID=1872085 RepID=UPI001A1D10A4|nr:DUF2071 domain-containing protein [Williamsia sp.]MBJ7290947.1 DUF2071 domain-containing protein [Williamsia sp.]
MPLSLGRMNATIERRMLINYRVDQALAQTWLPDGFRVQMVGGSAIAGICMIRLARMAPVGVPTVLGWGGENAAERVAVEWTSSDGTPSRGVFITRRFSASRTAVALGGRLFPGVHTKAAITSDESPERIALRMTTPTDTVDADVRLSTTLSNSVFESIDEASEFFRAGSTGWSPASKVGDLDGLRLDTDAWRVEPTTPVDVRASLFDNLPAGSAELDSVLVMRNVPAVWNPVTTR